MTASADSSKRGVEPIENRAVRIETSKTTYRLEGKKSIVFERQYEAPPEQVFAAFCDPQRVALWWGSPNATLEVREYNVRTGGTWRVVETDSKGKKTTFHGEYRNVTPPTRIVSTLCYGAGVASKLFAVQETYEFIPQGNGTLLRLTSRYPMGAALKGMLSVGMDDAGGYHDGSRHQWRLDRLAKILDEVA